jgi:hypothetical protein
MSALVNVKEYYLPSDSELQKYINLNLLNVSPVWNTYDAVDFCLRLIFRVRGLWPEGSTKVTCDEPLANLFGVQSFEIDTAHYQALILAHFKHFVIIYGEHTNFPAESAGNF